MRVGGLVLAAGALSMALALPAMAAGITAPVKLPAFDPNAAACSVPPGLEPALGFARDNDRQFIMGVGDGLEAAAEDRGLRYEESDASNDAGRQVEQITDFNSRRFGAVVTPPVDTLTVSPVLIAAIEAGSYVGTVVPPPAITILNAPQYLTGKVLADDAAAYIRTELGGRADVVLLTQDSMQFLSPRFAAMRDALNLPGVRILADISPQPVNEAGGYETMKLILEAHQKVDVVLGADTVVLGALRALREAGKDRPDQYLGGIDGEPEAVAEIKRGGAYKASVALSSPVFGYALGWFAADWLEGKSVPQAMDILPFALTAENIAQYEADQADPSAVFADPARRESYLRMYGNICYDRRADFLNFPWSSEAE